jgi:indolepyruvate ferredoxin oxidoreductase
LRGSRFDPFGWTAERKQERRLIEDYERVIERLLPSLSSTNHATALEIVRLPEEISGYGPIKAARVDRAEAKARDLLVAFEQIDDQGAWSDQPWLIAAE